MTILIQRPVINPCFHCARELSDPETSMPSALYGTPDKDWLVAMMSKLSESIDEEVSFGNAPGAKIPLCRACRDGLMATLDPDVILDYRDGGSTPKIVSGRDPIH